MCSLPRVPQELIALSASPKVVDITGSAGVCVCVLYVRVRVCVCVLYVRVRVCVCVYVRVCVVCVCVRACVL